MKNVQNERTRRFGNQEVNGLATAEQTQAATFDTTNPNNTFQLKGLFFSLSDWYSSPIKTRLSVICQHPGNVLSYSMRVCDIWKKKDTHKLVIMIVYARKTFTFDCWAEITI